MSDVEPNKSRRKLPRGCWWLIWGGLGATIFLIALILGIDIYVNHCGFPYVTQTSTQPLDTDREVISAANLSGLTELLALTDGDDFSNIQPRTGLAISPASQWIAVGGPKQWGSGYSCSSIWLINAADLSSRVFSLGPGHMPGQLLFTSDEQWLYATSDGRVDAISPSNLSDRYTVIDRPKYSGHGFLMETFHFPRETMLMILSSKEIPFYWDYEQRRSYAVPFTPEIFVAVKQAGEHIAYVTSDGDTKLYQYHVTDNKTTSLVKSDTSDPVRLAVNDAGTLVSVSSRGTNTVFDVKTKQKVFEVPAHGLSLRFSPQDRYFATGEGVWILEDRKQIIMFEHRDYDFAIFSPNEDLLLTATGGRNSRIDLWDLTTSQIIQSIDADAPLTDIDFSPDQMLIVASFDRSDSSVGVGSGFVKIWGIPVNKD